jgi:hypothetical protein
VVHRDGGACGALDHDATRAPGNTSRYSLPVVAGPFIAGIPLQANSWHYFAQGAFAVGIFFWMMFGTLIVGRLMTEERLAATRVFPRWPS